MREGHSGLAAGRAARLRCKERRHCLQAMQFRYLRRVHFNTIQLHSGFMRKVVILQPRRERSLLRYHPWVFSGAIARVEGEPSAGDTVEVHAADGQWLARGAYSPESQIRIRLWTWQAEERIDLDFFRRRLAACHAYRQALGVAATSNGWRLAHGEGDGLPGCVLDRYGDYYVCQFSSCGAERWKAAVVELLAAEPGIRGVYERSDCDSRRREGLSVSCGLLAGEEPPPLLELHEHGLRMWVDPRDGHKTGFYLDQRDNRRQRACYATAKELLNCFCYSGAFGIRAALAGDAQVTQLDSSEAALALAQQNVQLNGLPEERFHYVRADVFQFLRSCRDARQSYDVIILDPPKFADSQAQLARACRGYKDINLLAAKLLRPGGTLLTFSCSGAMTPSLFQKVVGDALRDAGRSARIVQQLSQAADHPRSLDFPEGHYLNGLELLLN
jgi:23S rRNA (cytosine1962-C5)-methyltransferase